MEILTRTMLMPDGSIADVLQSEPAPPGARPVMEVSPSEWVSVVRDWERRAKRMLTVACGKD